ncbi:hypothetical protein PIROE2DRAFT_4144 [Piromyces sp. E2]|nr:hypothetical protein PIROE2DRAFT_4144 [Piromyces sp. E2]|eukprot:OUM68259.1 hypothetical protein PIROE2DRAFT_4144 [Piromyces sp. E2]
MDIIYNTDNFHKLGNIDPHELRIENTKAGPVANAKHYAANNQETGRSGIDTHVSLSEISHILGYYNRFIMVKDEKSDLIMMN